MAAIVFENLFTANNFFFCNGQLVAQVVKTLASKEMNVSEKLCSENTAWMTFFPFSNPAQNRIFVCFFGRVLGGLALSETRVCVALLTNMLFAVVIWRTRVFIFIV